MIGIIMQENIWFSPYINIYTRFFDDNNINYEIVSWNRDGRDKPTGIQFNEPVSAEVTSRIKKLKPYIHYFKFVKRSIIERRYSGLVVVGPQLGILLSRFLRNNYKGRYIVDYRDLSVEQKPILYQIYHGVLKNSFSNVVSSPGFLRCLPTDVKYLISHNFDRKTVEKAISEPFLSKDSGNDINILTIGGIRDYSSNSELIDAISCKDGLSLAFIGRGPASEALERHAKAIGASNVSFQGFYEKKDEAGFIDKADVLNIYYPKIISHYTALSNRFYNALIFKKPMLVTKGGIQGDYVEKNGLGLALEDCNDIDLKLKEYMSSYDMEVFATKANKLLKSFLTEDDDFKAMLLEFGCKYGK